MKAVSAGNHSEQGNSTLEILIALAILTIALTAVILIVFGNQMVSADGRSSTQALYQAQLMIEKTRALAAQNFTAVISSSSINDFFTNQLTVTDLTQCQKRITSSVRWSTDPDRPEDIELTSDVTNLALGGDCASVVATSSWSAPQSQGAITLGQSSATGIDVQNHTVFLSATASTAPEPDVFIVDVTDASHPMIASGINTGPGLNAIDIAWGYAFVANVASTSQLQVIDVSDIGHPILVAARTLPGVSGANPQGNTLFYYNARLYIGTKRTAGHEFHIYDVSDPTNPINLGHIEVNYNVNAIAVQGSTAYLAVSAGATHSLLAYTITDPAHIPAPIGTNPCSGGGRSVYIVGTTLYLGCAKATGADDLYVLDITNPLTPTVIGSTRVGATINSIRVAGTFAFLATSDTKKEFQVWNISHPTSMTLVHAFDFPQQAVGIDYEHDTVYAGVSGNDALRIMNSK